MSTRKLRLTYWQVLWEFQAWHVAALNAIPGTVGGSIRRRYYAARLGSCGVAFTTGENVRIQSPANVRVGDHVTIGHDCYLSTSGGLEIGSNTFIGPGTKIWTNNHLYDDPSVPFVNQGYRYKPVVIEHDVWIGPRCFIKPGTVIKAGAVIGPGTILAKSVPPFAIVLGNPGKIVGWRKLRTGESPAATEPPP